MRRSSPCGWAGVCLLGALLTCGCQHGWESCAADCAAVTMLPPTPASSTDYSALPTGSSEQSGVPTAAKIALPTSTTAPSTIGSTSGLAHDAQYHWLAGTLEYSRTQQAWLLHYLPVDQDDRYGGCVTLVVTESQMNYKPGQLVRVEGEMIDPESRQLQPAFSVEKIAAGP